MPVQSPIIHQPNRTFFADQARHPHGQLQPSGYSVAVAHLALGVFKYPNGYLLCAPLVVISPQTILAAPTLPPLPAPASMPSGRLPPISKAKPKGPTANVNLAYLEHHAGVRSQLSETHPDQISYPTSGKTDSRHDWQTSLLDSEISVLKAIQKEIKSNRLTGDRDLLPDVQRLISNHEESLELALQINSCLDCEDLTPSLRADAAAGLLRTAVKRLPAGDTLNIPLSFLPNNARENRIGHGIYVGIKKLNENHVDITILNRGLGSAHHQQSVFSHDRLSKMPSGFLAKRVPIYGHRGLSTGFFREMFNLARDNHPETDKLAKAKAALNSQKPARNKMEGAEVEANLDLFYNSVFNLAQDKRRQGTIWQAPQKDGNCGYSSLKAAQKHTVSDPANYKRIDQIRSQIVKNVAQRYLEHLRRMAGPHQDMSYLARSGQLITNKLAKKARVDHPLPPLAPLPVGKLRPGHTKLHGLY